MIATKKKNSKCGSCSYYSEKVRYELRVRIDFTMADEKTRFSSFEDSIKKYKQFRSAVISLLKTNVPGISAISMYVQGQINQEIGSKTGYVYYVMGFHDNESPKQAAFEFFSNSNIEDYLPDLNKQLNLIMKTVGITYITGKIRINPALVEDLGSPQKGYCGCLDELGSGSLSNFKQSNIQYFISSAILVFSILVLSF